MWVNEIPQFGNDYFFGDIGLFTYILIFWKDVVESTCLYRTVVLTEFI